MEIMSDASIATLLEVVHHYYPEAKWAYDSNPRATPEGQRYSAAWQRALEDYARWVDLVQQFEQGFPEYGVMDITMSTGTQCYRVGVSIPKHEIPVRPPCEIHEVIGCVSILAPVYLIYGLHRVFTIKRVQGSNTLRFQLTGEMARCATRLSWAIEQYYPSHRPLPIEAGEVRIVDRHILSSNYMPGELTLRDALFCADLDNVQ
jgi:hypothetical protein